MTYYKVFQKVNNRLLSCCGLLWPKEHKFTIEYFEGRENKPKSYQNPFIFVFTSLVMARFFAEREILNYTKYEIWEVEPINILTAESLPFSYEFIVDGKKFTVFCPNETAFCSAVKLIKKIDSRKMEAE